MKSSVYSRNEKKKKAYTSIIIVPRNDERKKKREIRVRSPFLKIAAVFAFMVLMVVVSVFYVRNISTKNQALKDEVSKLNGLISEQNNLIQYRAEDVSKLDNIQTTVNDKINEFSDKYKSMTETFLRNKAGTAAARTVGDTRDKDFIAQLDDIHSILTTLTEIKLTDTALNNNLQDVENRLRSYLDSMPASAAKSGSTD